MQDLSTELKAFFEENELAIKAAASLRNGREIALNIIFADGNEKAFTFGKESGRNVLRESASKSPDMSFRIPENAARSLTQTSFSTIGEVGLHIFEKILSNDPSEKIQVKMHAGVLGLVTGGYFGVLSAGGADIARFLATRGLGNMGKLKDAIGKMKG